MTKATLVGFISFEIFFRKILDSLEKLTFGGHIRLAQVRKQPFVRQEAID